MTENATGRNVLAQALKAALPTWQVVSSYRGLDTVRKPGAVVLWTAKRTRFPSLGLGWYQEDVVLWVLTAADKPELVEDDLDELSLQLFTALEPIEGFSWSEAERGVLADTFEGYRLTLTCVVHVEPDTEQGD